MFVGDPDKDGTGHLCPGLLAGGVGLGLESKKQCTLSTQPALRQPLLDSGEYLREMKVPKLIVVVAFYCLDFYSPLDEINKS